MLEIRTHCESCRKVLPPESTEAMICSFECTFCKNCVEEKLLNVCPNCGGGFQQRPLRPKNKMTKYPPKNNLHIKDYSEEKHEAYLKDYKNTKPEDR